MMSADKLADIAVGFYSSEWRRCRELAVLYKLDSYP